MATLLSGFAIHLDTEKVLRGQGADPARVKQWMADTAARSIPKALELIRPAAVYDFFTVQDFSHRRIILEGGAFFEGKLVARALAGAAAIALAVCTIGEALDEEVAHLMAAGQMVEALALDGTGVAALREVSLAVRGLLAEEAAARDWRTGMRANPGQEEWPLEQQRTVFSLLPAGEIGVRLTDSCLMIPRKSVSFAIGMGAEMREGAVPCDFCSKKERCRWRIQSEAGACSSQD